MKTFEELYQAYLKAVKGEYWLEARTIDVMKILKMKLKDFDTLLEKIMMKYGPPYIELIQPSITSPRWKPVKVFGKSYWWIKVRKLK